MDFNELDSLYHDLISLPSVSIDHLGLSRKGLLLYSSNPHDCTELLSAMIPEGVLL